MAESRTPIKVEISHKTVFFTVAFLAGVWLLVQIKEIIIFVFLSIIFLSALLKPVEWLTNRKIPRVLSILIVYALVIAFISFAIGTIFPPLISESSDFVAKLPQIVANINSFIIFNKIPVGDFSSVISSQAENIASNLFSISSTIFSSIFLIVTLFVFSFYVLLEWNTFVRMLASSFSGKQEKKIVGVVSKVESGLGSWVRGQLSLSLIIGILTYIGLRILGIPYALPLALIAGILEIVPIIGPIISAIPATLVALSTAPVLALAVIALFIVIQQLENHLLVPMVMSKVVGLQPAFVIIALLVGAKLAGIGGAFLAVPLIVVSRIIFKEFVLEDQKIEEVIKD